MEQVPPHFHKEDRILEKDLIPDDTVYESLPATAPEGARAVVESGSLIKFYRMVKGIWRQLNATPEINHFMFPLPWYGTNSTGVPLNANTTRVMAFLLPGQLTVNSIHCQVVIAGAAGTLFSLGIYSIDGTTRHIYTGTQAGDSLGIRDITISPAVTLNPGNYFMAWTSNDTNIQLRGQPTDNDIDNIFNSGMDLSGLADASSGGVLPSTITIATPSQIDVPYIKLQN